MIAARLLPVIALLFVSGCDAELSSDTRSCPERFADLSRNQIASDAARATYLFDLSKLDQTQRQNVIKERGALLDVVIGGSAKSVEEWKAKPIHQDRVLFQGDQALGRFVSGVIADAAQAVSEGCALEARYGRLQSISIDLPNPRMDVTN